MKNDTKARHRRRGSRCSCACEASTPDPTGGSFDNQSMAGNRRPGLMAGNRRPSFVETPSPPERTRSIDNLGLRTRPSGVAVSPLARPDQLDGMSKRFGETVSRILREGVRAQERHQPLKLLTRPGVNRTSTPCLYGSLRFPGSHRPPAKWAAIGTRSKVDDVKALLLDTWDLPPPAVIISVTELGARQHQP